MAITETSSFTDAARSQFGAVARPFVAFAEMLVRMGEIYYQASEASYRCRVLMDMSDEELAARGLTRADIPRAASRSFLP